MTGDVRPQCPTCGTLYPPGSTYCSLDGSRLSGAKVQSDSMVGRDIDGRYIVRGMLGTGGIASVYTGLQIAIDREVAIKVIHSTFTDVRTVASRLMEAGRIACQLSGPNIVTMLDFGQSDDGTVYLVMERVRGRTLAAELAVRPLSARRVIATAMQICDALAVAHGRGVVHGCLRPSNVMLVDEPARRDQVKVLDFGMVSPPSDPNAHIHAHYQAPEVQPHHAGDARADLYSLGAMMFELLTGTPPQPEAKLPPNVPLALSELIGQLLAKAPSDRPGSAPAVRRALEPLHIEGGGITPPVPAPVIPPAAPGPPGFLPMPPKPESMTSLPVTPEPSSLARRILVISSVAIATTGLGLLGYYLATS
ncbi:MAG TPA: serine/threonine-protein kinase [Kofleriaceae bacterium]